jgi:hypothetical protein
MEGHTCYIDTIWMVRLTTDVSLPLIARRTWQIMYPADIEIGSSKSQRGECLGSGFVLNLPTNQGGTHALPSRGPTVCG